MKLLRISFIILLLVGFGMILTAQRLESKNTDIKINQLEEEILELKNKKRVVKQLIEAEYERLALDYDPENTLPISMNDIITVHLTNNPSLSQTEIENISNDPVEKLIAFIMDFNTSTDN